MIPLPARALWRHLWHHPWQVVLTVFGITLGVAVVVAVDLANSSAQKAFALSLDRVSGDATHQIVGGPGGLDERLYTRLRVAAGIRASAPVVEAYGTTAGVSLRLIGSDPLAGLQRRELLPELDDEIVQRLIVEPGSVLMSADTAARLGVDRGGTLPLEMGGRTHALTLIGFLNPGTTPAAALEGLVVADIATVQEIAGQVGRLSWIDLRAPSGEMRQAWLQRVRDLLPDQARLLRAESRTQAMAEMTHAFRTNLTAMGLLALVVGMFLIYNTMTFAVLQRRGLIGSLRIQGATRAQIFALILGESLAIGVVGTLLGLALGTLLAQGLVQLVTRTINDLYFVVTVNRLLITPAPLIKGIAIGVGATTLAALLPAWEAARTAPQAALRRSLLEAKVHRFVPHLALLGGLAVAAAAIVLWAGERDLISGFAALFLLIVGLTLISPLAVAGMTRLTSAAIRPLAGIQAQLAIRGVYASLSRTGVAIAALMLAVATTVGVGIMVDSFRGSVQAWLESRLQADVYVRAPTLGSTRTASRLDPAFVERVRALDSLAELTTVRHVTLESASGFTRIEAIDMAPERATRYRLKHGEPERVWSRFLADKGVLVSEPYAFHHQVQPGDTLTLPTDGGRHSFEVLGVYYDYGSEQGYVLMNRSLYDRHFNDPAISSLGLHLTPGGSTTEAMHAVRRAAAATGTAVEVRASRAIREYSLVVFDQTFAITNVLRMLAVIVAFVGILTAFMALQLERTKEMAVLRATGITPRQVGGMIGLQTGFMGLAAGVLALPTGAALALMLIHVINRRAFGWTMQISVEVEVLAQAVLLALAAALAAGLYPAWRLARVTPAAALREE